MRTIFITGTDTGVGKTLLTALLLCHLRGNGCSAVAMKPFSSGSREDAELLCAVQNGSMTLEEINPFHFSAPLAPLVAARKRRRIIPLEAVLASIEGVKHAFRPVTLLIEGAGGLLAPLGEDYSAVDLIGSLRCSVIIVGRNQLGTLNHTLLTARELGFRSERTISKNRVDAKVVLMNQKHKDPSARSNLQVLSELLAKVPVFSIPFLGDSAARPQAIDRSEKRLSALLTQILE